MNLPSREKCFELMDKYKMYDNIKVLFKRVDRVAVFFAGELKTKGAHVDEDLVSRAALLHDIGKVEAIEGG
ncbi:MAG: HD domain-containing protein, partial [bacterium]